ncbi:ABC transporter ATP-binding protein [Trichococcus paludicola]|uniref:ABC transporter ATP-binding protein n=1 Tax=Trichococcus paludicola TaxID=2052942 RepID=UPI000D3B15F3|nr:ABC transporter ATP-binding protein [Trichococcus paludicola]
MSGSVWSKTISLKEQLRVVKRIFHFAHPFRNQFLIALLFSIALSLVNVVAPRIIQIYMDDYLAVGNVTTDISVLFALAYVGVVLLKMLVTYLQRYIFSMASEQTVENIRNAVFRKVNQLGMRYYDTTPAGSIVSRVTNDTETIKEFWNVFLALAEGIFSIITVFIAMWTLDKQISLLFIVFVPIMAGLIWYYQKYSTRVYRTMRERLSQLNTKLNESISGMAIIQQFRQEKRLRAEFDAINEDYSKGRVAMVQMNALMLMPVVNLLQAIALAIVLWLFGYQTLNGVVELGVIYAFTTYIQNFFRPMGMMMDNLSALQDGIVSSSRVLSVLDNAELAPSQPGDSELEIAQGRIEFKDVSFSYDGKQDVLKNISFTANPGETVALVGHTGSGKSSIINVLLRFYEFEKGDILIDGKSIKTYPIEEIRSKIGLVLQDSFLFYGDISHNIRLMNKDYTDRDIEGAAAFVHADSFIASLPGGYHAKVIERGASYSSGERQLISFARTILRDPKVLILDEATANIDTETELLIQESMRKMREGRTTIAIAHRLSTIRDAHLILVLEKGRVIERGTHEELISKQGTYYDMYMLQSMND